jgi:hypothetical protein
MTDLTPVIETLENRLMRAWVQRDAKALKAVTGRNFMLLMGSTKPMILDARSWVEAATTRYLCSSYRLGNIYVRDLGGVAVFASQLDLQATLDDVDWSGSFWITDVWKKGRIRRGWRLAQRVVSLPDDDPEVPVGIRALQLWRSKARYASSRFTLSDENAT